MLLRIVRRELECGGGIELAFDQALAEDLVALGVGSPSELIEYGVVRLLATHRSTRCGTIFQQHQPGKERGARVCLECRIQQGWRIIPRSEEHTSELQSLMRISSAVFCLKTNKNN